LAGVNEFNFLGCDESVPSRSTLIGLRDNMQKAMLDAPFWQQGGILYAHLLVPHPLFGVALKSLQEEYTDNIAHGSALVKLVAEKAKLLFGDNFEIIVFSDHPLRPEIWCIDKTYKELGCKVNSTQVSSQVPVIVATPSVNKKTFQSISSHQNIFDLLY
jgi:hypothetical protein